MPLVAFYFTYYNMQTNVGLMFPQSLYQLDHG